MSKLGILLQLAKFCSEARDQISFALINPNASFVNCLAYLFSAV